MTTNIYRQVIAPLFSAMFAGLGIGAIVGATVLVWFFTR